MPVARTPLEEVQAWERYRTNVEAEIDRYAKELRQAEERGAPESEQRAYRTFKCGMERELQWADLYVRRARVKAGLPEDETKSARG